MRTKLLLVLVLAALSVLLLHQTASFSKIQEAILDSRLGQLTRRANKAKTEGKKEVDVSSGTISNIHSPVISQPSEVRNLISSYSVVIAQPYEERSVAVDGDSKIVTWYKFRIVETLSQGNAPPSNYEPPIPNEILPVNPDDLLVFTEGGTVEIDGVKVIDRRGGSPRFVLEKSYLLIVSRHTSGFGELVVGPEGTFLVGPDYKLRPVRKSSTSDLIMDTIGDSLEKTRLKLKSTKG